LKGEYLGKGTLHHRQEGQPLAPAKPQGKPRHNPLDLLLREHQDQLAANTRGIDYRKVVCERQWPFYAFAKTLAHLLGHEEGLSAFTADELEALKKFYNRYPNLTEPMLKEALEKTQNKTLPYLIYELGQLLKTKE
jgi:hypothetical protein